MNGSGRVLSPALLFLHLCLKDTNHEPMSFPRMIDSDPPFDQPMFK